MRWSSTASAFPSPATRNWRHTDWSGCDVVIEASGKFRKPDVLQPYLDQGVKRVVVTAPVKEAGVLDVVMGVNHGRFDPAVHRIVTAASCTTNCLAPVVKVIHEGIGIRHGSHHHHPRPDQHPDDPRCAAQGSAPRARLRHAA